MAVIGFTAVQPSVRCLGYVAKDGSGNTETIQQTRLWSLNGPTPSWSASVSGPGLALPTDPLHEIRDSIKDAGMGA